MTANSTLKPSRTRNPRKTDPSFSVALYTARQKLKFAQIAEIVVK